MIEFFKKNEQNIMIIFAMIILIICYLQQKELSKLRKEISIYKEMEHECT